jgi:hypothetical protein
MPARTITVAHVRHSTRLTVRLWLAVSFLCLSWVYNVRSLHHGPYPILPSCLASNPFFGLRVYSHKFNRQHSSLALNGIMSVLRIIPRLASFRSSIRFNSSPRLTSSRSLGTYLNNGAVQTQIASRPFHSTAVMGADTQTRVKKIISEQLGIKPEEVRECSKFPQRAPLGIR